MTQCQKERQRFRDLSLGRTWPPKCIWHHNTNPRSYCFQCFFLFFSARQVNFHLYINTFSHSHSDVVPQKLWCYFFLCVCVVFEVWETCHFSYVIGRNYEDFTRGKKKNLVRLGSWHEKLSCHLWLNQSRTCLQRFHVEGRSHVYCNAALPQSSLTISLWHNVNDSSCVWVVTPILPMMSMQTSKPMLLTWCVTSGRL